MLRGRLLVAVFIMVGLMIFLSACGGNQSSEATPTDTPAPAAQEVATEVSEAETEAEATVEEVATEVPEAEAEAEETAEPVATEEAAVEEAGEEAVSQAEAMVNPSIQVASETNIADVINVKTPSLVTLSTSGAQLTWPQVEGRMWNREGQLCLYTFTTAATDCVEGPEKYEGYPYAFFWSPDDQYIAFTEDPIALGNESDIWVFDTTNSEFVNLTDDGVEGSWVGAEPGSYALDYLPMWNENDGKIYFWRSIPDPSMVISITLDIMRVSPQGGDPELVREVQGVKGGALIPFNAETWFMDGVSVLSPDGRYVAVLAISESDTDVTADDGLWLVDLEDTSVPPQQLATSDDFQIANFSWAGSPLNPAGLSWQADGEHVVVLAQNNDTQVPVVVLYDVDVNSGEMTPVVDFSSIADDAEYMAQPAGEGLPPRAYSPWTASLTPDNQQILMYQNLANAAGLFVSPLPPTGNPPELEYRSEIENPIPVVRSSRSKDGKVLMYNILFNLVQESE